MSDKKRVIDIEILEILTEWLKIFLGRKQLAEAQEGRVLFKGLRAIRGEDGSERVFSEEVIKITKMSLDLVERELEKRAAAFNPDLSNGEPLSPVWFKSVLPMTEYLWGEVRLEIKNSGDRGPKKYG